MRAKWLDFDALVAQESEEFARPTGEAANKSSDPMLMFFTSGTTGYPKMVWHDFTLSAGSHPHRLLLAPRGGRRPALHHLRHRLGQGALGQIYGQWLGGSAVFTYDFEKFHAEDILHKMEQYHVTTFCAPPTMYRYMIRRIFPSTICPPCSTAPPRARRSTPRVYNQWLRQTGHKIFEGFGQTETTLCCLTAFPWMQPRLGSMGPARSPAGLVICDANDEEVPAGVTGEICVRTDGGKPFGLFGGYFRDRR